MKAWLKGGLMLSGIYFVVIIFFVIRTFFFCNVPDCALIFYVMMIPSIIPLGYLFDNFMGWVVLILAFILNLLIVFGIGALIGKIINLIIGGHNNKIETNKMEVPSPKRKGWLKYGLIAAVIGVVFFHQSMLAMNPLLPNFIVMIFGLPFILVGIFFPIIFVVGIVGIGIYFLIGVIIGLIIGKIKQRKGVVNE